MSPHSYPDLSWSAHVSRVVRTLQVVAIALTVGAIGGGIGVLALTGMPGHSPHQVTRADAVKPGTSSPPRSALSSQPSQSPPPAQPALAAAPKAAPRDVPAITPPTQPIQKQAASTIQLPPTRSETAATKAAQAGPSKAAHESSTAESSTAMRSPPAAPKASRSERQNGGQARTRAAEASQPAVKTLYDRAEPATADSNDEHPRSAKANAANRGLVGGKRVKKRTVASAPERQTQPAPSPRHAPPAVVMLPPPLAVAPPRAAELSDGQGGWRGRDRDDWRYSRRDPDGYAERDDWRARRGDSDQDYGRDGGRPGGGLFGLLFGGGGG